MKYRIKFAKVGNICFIGHLDLLKVFQRAIKRAELPIAYSNGFNPHQIIGFALPLPLGMSSVGEYVDFELKYEIDIETIMTSLNNTMPEGIKIIDTRKFTDNDKSFAAEVVAALYEIYLPNCIENFSNVIKDMLSLDKLEIGRTSKRKTKIVDIKGDIFFIEEICGSAEGTSFKALISAGSQQNLKPELLVKYIYGYIKMSYEPLKVIYKRIELFKKDASGKFLSL